MNKFTKGPWKVVADERYDKFSRADRIVGYDIKSEDGEIVGSEGISGDSDINLANARLIAAAPDLLEALDGLLASVDHGLYGIAISRARKAIVRARGEA